jgi:hypothetical protein
MKFSSPGMLTAEREPTENMTFSILLKNLRSFFQALRGAGSL